MRNTIAWILGISAVVLCIGGCPGTTPIADGNATTSDGGVAGAGSGSGGTTGGTSSTCPDGVPKICRMCADDSCGKPICVDGDWAFQCAEDPPLGTGGSTGGGSGGASGSGGTGGGTGDACPPNTPIPALCKLCPDGGCGEPVCSGGKFTGDFRCADAPGGTGGSGGGTGAFCGGIAGVGCAPDEFCNYPESAQCGAADQGGNCTAMPQACIEIYAPVCGCDGVTYSSDCKAAGAGVSIVSQGECGSTGGALKWYLTCGAPVCSSDPDPSDDPAIPNCDAAAGQKVGADCTTPDKMCDGVASCGVKMICATKDPTTSVGPCPVSRGRFKKDISYLGPEELQSYHTQVMQIPIAAYNYKHMPGTGPQLGFIIEDIEPSVAVSGDHVNLYGYLSMAVAAIKVQQGQIDSLQREIEGLRADAPNASQVCAP